ncbi:MAG: hypothetical protein ACEQSN_18565 [Yersinia sp. (in: enterobacteria)]
MGTLSNANSILMLKVKNLYPVPIPIQGYGVDDAFAIADVTSGESLMGIPICQLARLVLLIVSAIAVT